MTAYEPIEVEIRVQQDGGIQPLRFSYAGSWLTVAQIGRKWQDADGDHWLVTPAFPQQVFEVVRTPDGKWLAKRQGGTMQVA